jgi:hypothetical protein
MLALFLQLLLLGRGHYLLLLYFFLRLEHRLGWLLVIQE